MHVCYFTVIRHILILTVLKLLNTALCCFTCNVYLLLRKGYEHDSACVLFTVIESYKPFL